MREENSIKFRFIGNRTIHANQTSMYLETRKKAAKHSASSAKHDNKTAGSMKYALYTSCRQPSIGSLARTGHRLLWLFVEIYRRSLFLIYTIMHICT